MFSLLALSSGINSNWLNPSEKPKGKFSFYLGESLRITTRLIYCLVCLTVIPVIGALYHLGLALSFSFRDNRRCIYHLCLASFETLIAISLPILVFTSIKTFKFYLSCLKDPEYWDRRSPMHEISKLFFGISMISAFASAYLPLSYAIAPDSLPDFSKMN